MNYKNHISRDYYYVEKEPIWDDFDSNRSQKIMTGGYAINNLINEKDKIMRLSNYGIPAGLVLETQHSSPNKIEGGFLDKKYEKDEMDAVEIAPTMPFHKYDKLFDLVSVKSHSNNKTRKLQKSS